MFLTRQEIRQAAGHLVVCGFDGVELTAELKELLREINPLGLILFARNIQSPEQVAEFNRELKCHRAQEPLLLCVDQEGGRVARVKSPATEWPPMRQLGQLNDVALTERVGRALAQELRAMNFDIDFAPVLDVDTNPQNPVIGDRSFSYDPKLVGAHGAALIKGLQESGVGACGKHFPGHGDTDLDSHLALPRVGHDLGRLRDLEWPPFTAAIKAGVGAIMTAHVVVEALDEVPATLSHRALHHLRDELQFNGCIVSDDIEMKAVADRYSPTELAELGLKAGVDVFLACRKPEVTLELYRGLVVGTEEERLRHEDLADANRRALRWRDRFCKPAVDYKQSKTFIGSQENADLVQEIVQRSRAGA